MEAAPAVFGEELPGVKGVHTLQDFRSMKDLFDAEHGERREPEQHHPAKHASDAARADALHAEQADEDHHGEWDDVWLERGRGNFETFHRTKHGDSGGDESVAIK